MEGLFRVLLAVLLGWSLLVMIGAMLLSGFLVFSALQDLWRTGRL